MRQGGHRFGGAHELEAAEHVAEHLRRATAVGRGKPFYASPVLANGALYAVSRRTGAYVIAAQPEFKLLGQNRFTDDSDFNATPAIAGKQLFLRSNRSLYCVALPGGLRASR